VDLSSRHAFLTNENILYSLKQIQIKLFVINASLRVGADQHNIFEENKIQIYRQI
jgi:cob(I)alamin adenosyltransferase